MDLKEHLPALVCTEPTSNSRDLCKESRKRPYRCSVRNGSVEDDTVDKKRRLTAEQLDFLEMSFTADLKLEPERKAFIAKQLGLRPRQVAIWFQNRRARWKNKHVEQDYLTLKASYDAVIKGKESLTKEYESAIESNKRLQAEVIRLTNLLQGVNGTDVTAEPPSSKEERPSCHLELMSPTKSADCHSEVEDLVMPMERNMSNPDSQGLNSIIACTPMGEGDYISFLSSDNTFNSLPLLVQQLVANGHCIEDAYNIYLGCEYFGGGWR